MCVAMSLPLGMIVKKKCLVKMLKMITFEVIEN